jgi:hypothetical protein
MIPAMTAPDDPPAEDPGVLSSLPGTRPQRRSPKRDAAPTPAAAARPTPPRKRNRRPPEAGKPPPSPPTAAQGYEADPIKGSVNPPSGSELVSSLTQAASELAGIAINLAKRLARTTLDRLPRL